MFVQLLNGLALGVLLAVLSAGLALIFGLRGVVNFAHGSIYMAAAYLASTISAHSNFWVALVVTPVLFSIAGMLLDRYGLRYLAERDPLDLILLTFGLTYVINDVVQTLWAANPRSMEAPHGLTGSAHIFAVTYPTYRLFLIGVGLLAVLSLVVWLGVSKMGLYVRASSSARVTAGVVGVDVDRVSAVVVGLGAGLAGLAGVLAGPYLSLTLDMGITMLVLAFIVVVVGGLGSLAGALIMALIVGMTNSFGAVIAPDLSSYLPYALMLVVLLVRPQGLAGKRTTL